VEVGASRHTHHVATRTSRAWAVWGVSTSPSTSEILHRACAAASHVPPLSTAPRAPHSLPAVGVAASGSDLPSMGSWGRLLQGLQPISSAADAHALRALPSHEDIAVKARSSAESDTASGHRQHDPQPCERHSQAQVHSPEPGDHCSVRVCVWLELQIGSCELHAAGRFWAPRRAGALCEGRKKSQAAVYVLLGVRCGQWRPITGQSADDDFVTRGRDAGGLAGCACGIQACHDLHANPHPASAPAQLPFAPRLT
jgi:hypothetical protein